MFSMQRALWAGGEIGSHRTQARRQVPRGAGTAPHRANTEAAATRRRRAEADTAADPAASAATADTLYQHNLNRLQHRDQSKRDDFCTTK